MTRSPLLLLALAVGACSSPPSGLSPDDAIAEAHAAAQGGDVGRALDLIDEAAASGDIRALAFRADTYARGSVRVPMGYVYGETAHDVAFWAWPWEARDARRTFERALAERVGRGDHDARFVLAGRLAEMERVGGEWVRRDLDSARAVYHALEADGAEPFRLAALAMVLGDEAGWDRHVDAAAAEGHPEACGFQAMRREDGRAFLGAVAIAASIDAVEACRQRGPDLPGGRVVPSTGEHLVGTLAEQSRLGNGAAVATLDSLRQSGVFERHPRLAALAETATDA